jgi:hypothetical protein
MNSNSLLLREYQRLEGKWTSFTLVVFNFLLEMLEIRISQRSLLEDKFERNHLKLLELKEAIMAESTPHYGEINDPEVNRIF